MFTSRRTGDRDTVAADDAGIDKCVHAVVAGHCMTRFRARDLAIRCAHDARACDVGASCA